MIEQEDKVELTRKRAELVELLATPLSNDDRIRVQGELSLINARIKAINTTAAAQAKAAADRRKVAGLAEAHANAARARARVDQVFSGASSTGPREDLEDLEDDDPGQTAAIDGWVDAVLLRHDVEFTRSKTGEIALDVEPKWAAVIGTLIDGIYAAARGHELPDLPRAELKAVQALRPKPPKPPKPPTPAKARGPKTARARKRP